MGLEREQSTFLFVCFLSSQKEVKFGVNLDITRYTNGKRETLNPPGRAFAPVVWDFYKVNIYAPLLQRIDIMICVASLNLHMKPSASFLSSHRKN